MNTWNKMPKYLYILDVPTGPLICFLSIKTWNLVSDFGLTKFLISFSSKTTKGRRWHRCVCQRKHIREVRPFGIFPPSPALRAPILSPRGKKVGMGLRCWPKTTVIFFYSEVRMKRRDESIIFNTQNDRDFLARPPLKQPPFRSNGFGVGICHNCGKKKRFQFPPIPTLICASPKCRLVVS